MGFFGKLFEKKICDICGDEIGLLGNRKLEDGNCCKTCAARLSPWFSERRQSTVEEIKEQLAYRESNREAVAQFHTTRTLGRNMKVLLDEDAGKFMVTRARNLEEANPDVLDFSQVTGCELDIRESEDEVYREIRDKEGHTRKESYQPRRYNYSYEFFITIFVNHPYFDRIEYSLSDGDVAVDARGGKVGMPGMFGGNTPEGSTRPPTLEERQNDVDYAEFELLGNEIRDALTQVRTQVREEAEAANAPVQSVTCPWCGATTVGDATGCCEYCGGSLKG